MGLYFLILKFLESRWEDRLWTDW